MFQVDYLSWYCLFISTDCGIVHSDLLALGFPEVSGRGTHSLKTVIENQAVRRFGASKVLK